MKALSCIKPTHKKFLGCCCCGLKTGVQIFSGIKLILIVASIASNGEYIYYNLANLLVIVESLLAIIGASSSNASKAASLLRWAIVVIMIESVLNIVSCVLMWILLSAVDQDLDDQDVDDQNVMNAFKAVFTVTVVVGLLFNYFYATSIESLAHEKEEIAAGPEAPNVYAADPNAPRPASHDLETQVVYVHHTIDGKKEDHQSSDDSSSDIHHPQEEDYLRKKETV